MLGKEVLKKAKEGDSKSIELIVMQYKPLVIKLSKAIFLKDYDIEDLIQMGYITIMQAIKKYDESKNVNFTMYVRQALQNNYNYEIRKKAKENYVGSLNHTIDEGIELIDGIMEDYDLEEKLIEALELEKVKEIINNLKEEDKEFIQVVYSKRHGGITEYARSKGLEYKDCVKKRKILLKEIRKAFGG